MKWLVLVVCLQTSLVFADEAPARVPAAPAPAAPDKDGFERVTDRDLEKSRVDETINGATMIASAYGFIFAAVMIYVGWIARRAHRVEGDLNDLHARLGKQLDALEAGKKRA